MPDYDDIQFLEEGDYTHDEYIAAFQRLINSGTVWKLQGWYGRQAKHLLDGGYCTLPEPE